MIRKNTIPQLVRGLFSALFVTVTVSFSVTVSATTASATVANAQGISSQNPASVQNSTSAEPTASESKVWTLQDCIAYATEHNITLQQNKLSIEAAQTDLKTAKAALFPSLNFSTSHSLINRPFQNGSTTVSGTEILSSNSGTSYTGSYGFDANWTLYNGGENRKNIKLQTVNTEISMMSAEESLMNIQENIIQLYIQILYSTEAVNICQSTLELSQAELERGRALYQAGSISRADLAQLQAQESSDSYNLVTSKTNLQDYQLQLKQVLEIDGDITIELLIPDIPDEAVQAIIPDKATVYNAALQSRPEILSKELSINASELDIAIARSGYLPSLRLSAGIGTNHTTGTNFSFTEQIKNGWNNSIGLTLSVPITSNRQNKSAVEKARVQSSISKIELTQARKDLYKKIESLYLEASSSQEEFIAAKAQEESASISYELVSEQFNTGLKNTVELLTEKNNYSVARQQSLQAKYMAILNLQLLKYYGGEDLSL